MTRAEKIARYRALRIASRDNFDAAIGFISRGTLLEYGRKLGLVLGGNTIVCDSLDDMAFVYDLGLYTAKDGRSRGIDRYARSVRPVPGSDSALMLEAAQRARFALCRVVDRHETAGLNVLDLAHDRLLWLMDEGYEASMPNGSLFASRLKPVEDFVMTTGAAVPLPIASAEQVLDELRITSPGQLAKRLEDPRLAIAVFRAHLSGATGVRMEHQSTWDMSRIEAA